VLVSVPAFRRRDCWSLGLCRCDSNHQPSARSDSASASARCYGPAHDILLNGDGWLTS